MSDSTADIRPHEIAELRQLADKAGLEGDWDAYRALHALLDGYESSDLGEKKAKRLEEFEDAIQSVDAALKDLRDQISALENLGKDIEDELSQGHSFADRLLKARRRLREIDDAIFEAMPVAEAPPKKQARKVRS